MTIEKINWKIAQAKFDELIEIWRPKEIRRYEENGKTVRVFEPPQILRS